MSDTLSTSDVGVNAAGVAFQYAAGNVTRVPRGSTITYGPWQTVPGAALGPGVYEISDVGGGLQAANAGFIRTVTLTPVV